MIKVLLISPKDPKRPRIQNLKFLTGGENTYTNLLLKYPPKGVQFIHYEDALQKGQIEYGRLNQMFKWLMKFRLLPLSTGTIDIKLNTNFDLIHCHTYSLKLRGQGIAVVMSDSSSNFLTLKEYFSWLNRRIRATYFIRKIVHKAFKVYDFDLNLGEYKKLIVHSKYAKELHIKHGAHHTKVKVVYPGLPSQKMRRLSSQKPEISILFVGTWFKRKGGDLLIQAYRQLSTKYSNVGLTVIGDIPKDVDISNLSNFTQNKWVSRKKLFTWYYLKADILVHVPRKTEGYGFVVQEAMSFGVPCIVSRIGALPELVENNKTGFVIKPDSVNELLKSVEKLVVDHKLRNKMAKNAKIRFSNKFEIKKMQSELLTVYTEAVNSF